MKMRIALLLSLMLVLTITAGAQNGNIKKLDRKKWKELVDEINRKRYDKAEKESSYEESPETEYSNYENTTFGEGGDGNGNSSSSGEYNTSTDDGIYDGSISDDGSFFDEENDRTGNGTGNDPWGDNSGEGGNGEVDPRYNDEGNGSGPYRNNNREYESSDNSEQRQIIYRDEKQPERETRSVSKSSEGGDSTWLIVVMIVLVAAAVVYMIIVSFSDKNKKVKAVMETDESKLENMTITKSELELALEAALAKGNYREAVRIYFIAVIKEMKDRSWIKWEKKKTNYHYINEISGRSQQPDFITATRAFEIVWYGNRSLGESEYRQIEPHFKKLLSSINA